MSSIQTPNIVLFVAEDLDYEAVNCYDGLETGYSGVISAGNPNFPNHYVADEVLTPAMDGLAAEGFRSENYYCASAICTPARYAILTGRYPERSAGFCRMYPPFTQANIFFNIGLGREEHSLPQQLKRAGFTTGMVGKWHNWSQEMKLRLTDIYRSFPEDADPREANTSAALKEWYRIAVEHLRDGYGWDYVDRVFCENSELFSPKAITSHNLEWIIEGGLDFLEQQRGGNTPFFLYVPVTIPHSRLRGNVFEQFDPLSTPAGMLDEPPKGMRSREEILKTVRDAGLPDYAIEGYWLDSALQAVLDKLTDIGRDQETCFIFTTDHPTAGKESCHLGRLPLIIRWPGHIEGAAVSRELLGQTDLAPTILDIAGVDIPQDMRTDGSSFKGLLTGNDFTEREQMLLEVTNSRGLVYGKWKYIANRLPPSRAALSDIHKIGWRAEPCYDNSLNRTNVPYNSDKMFPSYFEEDQLFDLENDPCEQNNLAGDPAFRDIMDDIKRRLAEELGKLPHRFEGFTP